MKTQILKLEDQEIEVKKLPLGKYADLLNSLEEIPKHLELLTSAKDSELFEQLPKIIAACANDCAKIIEISTNYSKEEILEKLGVDDITKIVLCIIEVNNYAQAWEDIKKMPAHLFKSTTLPEKS